MTARPIGALRRRVTLAARAQTPDGGGGGAVAWTPFATVWAEIKALTGQLQVVADGVQGRVTHEITIRKRMDVSPAARVLYGPRIFVVLAVLDRDGTDPFIRLQAEERLQ